jgi:hypothetical protein
MTSQPIGIHTAMGRSLPILIDYQSDLITLALDTLAYAMREGQLAIDTSHGYVGNVCNCLGTQPQELLKSLHAADAAKLQTRDSQAMLWERTIKDVIPLQPARFSKQSQLLIIFQNSHRVCVVKPVASTNADHEATDTATQM